MSNNLKKLFKFDYLFTFITSKCQNVQTKQDGAVVAVQILTVVTSSFLNKTT